MNEYTVRWPLWIPGGVVPEGELPVSEGLAKQLKAWACTFNEHYDYERGWSNRELAERHFKEAERLREALSADLGDGYEVVLELWEVEVSDT